MMHNLVQPRIWIFVKRYGLLSFAEKVKTLIKK